MDISVFGLGYVGAVTSACLAKEGHTVIGIDPNRTKVDLFNQGRSPIVEKDLDSFIKTAVGNGKLRATLDHHQAILDTEISLICVGTPSQMNGNIDLKYVRQVCEQIGNSLRQKDAFHVVVCRSTMLPGTMKTVVLPMLEEYSGKRAGEDFGVCNNPEFLREGTAVYDFYHPPKTVIGETDSRSGDILAKLYSMLDAPLIRTDLETAEMVKYTDNVWHALKVCFANEIGTICKALRIDSHQVMEIFCKDTKLNLSPYYLRPGFAFGGSCLPKDVRALQYKSRMLDLNLPILNSILPSNQVHIERALNMILSCSSQRLGVLGFSFKAGTDDLRESPMVEIIERLIGKGYDIRIYDKNVSLAKLMGANKDFLLNRIPHISRLMVETKEDLLSHAEVLVVGNPSEEFESILQQAGHRTVIDLVRVINQKSIEGRYEGICW